MRCVCTAIKCLIWILIMGNYTIVRIRLLLVIMHFRILQQSLECRYYTICAALVCCCFGEGDKSKVVAWPSRRRIMAAASIVITDDVVKRANNIKLERSTGMHVQLCRTVYLYPTNTVQYSVFSPQNNEQDSKT